MDPAENPPTPAPAVNITCAACRSQISADGRSVIEKSAHLTKIEGAEAQLAEKKTELASLSARVRELEQQIADDEPEAVPQGDGDSRDHVLQF